MSRIGWYVIFNIQTILVALFYRSVTIVSWPKKLELFQSFPGGFLWRSYVQRESHKI